MQGQKEMIAAPGVPSAEQGRRVRNRDIRPKRAGSTQLKQKHS